MNINSILQIYESSEELSEIEQKLVEIAYSQAKTAYAPYSKFRVGCAILLKNGKIVGGSNQENASFPAGICAERTALSTAASLFPEIPPTKIVIVVNGKEYQVVGVAAPCGICRQSIQETETKFKQSIEIIFPGNNGCFYKAKNIESLLPLSFKSFT